MARGAEWIQEALADLDVADDAGSWIYRVTGGWEPAVDACVNAIRSSDDPQAQIQSIVRSPRIVDALVRDRLQQLDEQDQHALGALAVLPWFNEVLADEIGNPGLVDRIRDADIPVGTTTEGRLRLDDPLRATCLGLYAPAKVPASAIDAYLRVADHPAALTALLCVGDTNAAAELLANLTIEQATEFEISSLNAAMSTIGPTALDHPRSLLIQARSNAIADQVLKGREILDRLEEHFAHVDPDRSDPVHHEFLCEFGVWLVFNGEDERARLVANMASGAIANDSDGELRAQLHDLVGLVASTANTHDGLLQARSELTKGLSIRKRIGDRRGATLTSFRLVLNVLRSLGRHREALEVLDSLSDLGPLSPIDTVRVQLYRTMMLPYVGRASDVASVVAEVQQGAAVLDQPWIAGWALWTDAIAASVLGDSERLIERVDELEKTDPVMLGELTTAAMWTDVAEALARTGDGVRADEALERAVARQVLHEWALDYIHGSLDVRHGDAERGRGRLAAYLDRPDMEPGKRWQTHLLLALANHRLQDGSAADKHLAEARRLAMEIGEPQLPTFVESAVLERLATAVEEPDHLAVTRGQVEVVLFGDFAVRSNGIAVDLPRGLVSTFIKLLALADHGLVVDQVIDVLWPDVTLDVGRRRLRNVVLRVRSSCGDIVVRDGETVSLADHVSVDFKRAVAAAKFAVASRDNAGLQTAQAALEQPLLPADRYADWAEDARLYQTSVQQSVRQASR